MFAVAQYYDGRQRKFMTEDHNSIWVFHLHDIADPHMRDIKNEFDRLLNIEPINNQNIIICLWVLLVFYTLLLMIILIDLFWIGTDSASISSNYSHIMTISSIFLFIFSGWLTVNLMKMRTQLREFRKDAKALNKIYEAVHNALENNI